ncbi:MAG: HD domain-containing phosphohydrolase [Clostridiaceae bacterium]
MAGGKGNPRGLKEGEIPLISKAICVADAYDSMIGNYVEKPQLSVEAAIKELKVNEGTQFDPEIARVFVEKVLGKEW